VARNLQNTTLSPSGNNPAGIFYRSGDINLKGNVVINGTLIVGDDLDQLSGNNTITAQGSCPAVIVTDEFKMKKGQLNVQGLVQVGGEIRINNKASNPAINITGGLCWQNGTVKNSKNKGYSLGIMGSSSDTVVRKWTSPTQSTLWTGASGGGVVLVGIGRN